MESNYKQITTTINISPTWTERIHLHRLADDTVAVSYEEDLSGTCRKLAYYNPVSKRWSGYSPTNYDMWFNILKRHKTLAPKVIRFITPLDKPYSVWKFSKTFTCFKRKVSIQIQKAATATKKEFDDLVDMFHG